MTRKSIDECVRENLEAYFTDLDGHLWEIAYNPTWPLRANGAMELPPPASGKG